MKPKVLGSALMIVGTSIGAGMLALPIVSASQGILLTIGMLFVCWVLMTLGAFNLLEVNLWLDSGANMVTMANKTLGKIGKLVCWTVYLALLYSLICAYLSGAGDVLHAILLDSGVSVNRAASRDRKSVV